MFEAKIKTDMLNEIVGILSTVVKDIKMKVKSKGIAFGAVDPSHVSLVEISLKASAFESLKADEHELGLDLDKVKSVLKLAKGEDVIDIKLDEDKGKLVFKIGDITRRLALIDTTGMSDPKIPDLKMTANMTIEVAELNQGIKACVDVSDHISLQMTKENFELVAKGETESTELIKEKKQLVSLEVEGDGAKSLYSLEYFSKMVQSVSGAKNVKMFMAKNYPLRFEFDVADGNGHAIYLIAPRLDNQ